MLASPTSNERITLEHPMAFGRVPLLVLVIVVVAAFAPAFAQSPEETSSPALGDRAELPDAPDFLVGAHYYPWYRAPSDEALERGEIGWMREALRGRLAPRQLPRVGIYDSRDPKVIAAHIAQSVQAGIDFWPVSWWGPESRLDRTFREHILEHPEAKKLRYAVLYESTGRLGSFEKPDYSNLVEDFRYLAKHYFDHPLYLRIDDRPVVFVYLTRVYFRDRGLEALAALREAFPKVYLVGDEVFGPRYHERHAKLFDAVTAYDVYGQSLQAHGATAKAIEELERNFSNARKIANDAGVAFVPAISPGFNDRAVRDGHPGRARAFSDREGSREGDIFREMIRKVARPLADPRAKRMILITSFNEWYEDTQIEPTRGDAGETAKDDSPSGTHYTEGDTYRDYGSLYLDILREELGEAATSGKSVRDAEDGRGAAVGE